MDPLKDPWTENLGEVGDGTEIGDVSGSVFTTRTDRPGNEGSHGSLFLHVPTVSLGFQSHLP